MGDPSAAPSDAAPDATPSTVAWLSSASPATPAGDAVEVQLIDEEDEEELDDEGEDSDGVQLIGDEDEEVVQHSNPYLAAQVYKYLIYDYPNYRYLTSRRNTIHSICLIYKKNNRAELRANYEVYILFGFPY